MNSNLLKFLSLAGLTATLGACVVTETTSGWTAEQKKREVDSCVASAMASLKANGKTAEDSKVNSYCNCIMDKVEAKYSYEEANREASKIIAEMESSGVIDACIESAGLK